MANVHDLLGRDDFAQNLAKTHQKFDALKNGDGGGTSNDMEARLVKIETDLKWVNRWLGGLTAVGLTITGAAIYYLIQITEKLASLDAAASATHSLLSAIATKVGISQ